MLKEKNDTRPFGHKIAKTSAESKMDPISRAFLIKKYNLNPMEQNQAFSSMDQSPADAWQASLGQQPQPPSPNLQDPPPPPPMPDDLPTPQAAAPKRSPQSKLPAVPDVGNDYGKLSDDELARYGIKTPEEV